MFVMLVFKLLTSSFNLSLCLYFSVNYCCRPWASSWLSSWIFCLSLSSCSIWWLRDSIFCIWAVRTSSWFCFNLKLSIYVSHMSHTRWSSGSVLDSRRRLSLQTLQMLLPQRLQCLIGFFPKALENGAKHSWQLSVGVLLTEERSNLIGKLLIACSKNLRFGWSSSLPKEPGSSCMLRLLLLPVDPCEEVSIMRIDFAVKFGLLLRKGSSCGDCKAPSWLFCL